RPVDTQRNRSAWALGRDVLDGADLRRRGRRGGARLAEQLARVLGRQRVVRRAPRLDDQLDDFLDLRIEGHGVLLYAAVQTARTRRRGGRSRTRACARPGPWGRAGPCPRAIARRR